VLAHFLFGAAIALAARSSARIIVPSLSARDDLIAALRVAPEKLAVTPLAPDARFGPIGKPEQERVRAKYSLPDHYLLYVGINKLHKNLATLMDAYHR